MALTIQDLQDQLNGLEALAASLKTADDAKTSNDVKFEAAKAAKDGTDKADAEAGNVWNAGVDLWQAKVAEFVQSAKVTR